MKNVKRIFFLTEEEAKIKREILGNKYIDFLSPHYELTDGTMVWGMVGGPATNERWHTSILPNPYPEFLK